MSTSDPHTLSRDEVYDILSNARRRFVIYYLRDRGEPVKLGELSDRVAAWENDVPVEELTDQQVKRVYVSLYQTHIPKLEDTGIVEYDADTGVVRLTSQVSDLDAYLPDEDEGSIPWQGIYLTLAVVGLAVYGVATAAQGAIPQSVLNAVGLLVFVSFGAVVIAQYLYERRNR
ncbi:hypothetical protein Hbl1158_15560 (plasmid) [Halobaculum sp. CBA1158]|uniref:DUF7344 domain-containing protein n=1 Tax=Halobaculum sp. CBA1158 TaxID=2904243 RepID=UPI001F3643B9|nr:hypothetical protein [Halobaculum sp. CBA1158]UIP01328.1 hypothetical protein Hbl1158_15560 [Halobaculum sp. CBA1158]